MIDLVRCERAALRWLARLDDAAQLLDELVADPGRLPPRSRGLGPAFRVPPFLVARGIVAFRDRMGGIGALEDLRAVRGVDDRWLADLLHTGCALAGPEPHADAVHVVGVLLPLRIETRFDPGTLRIRIVPDEPWFARHDDRTSEGEQKALARYVAAAAAAPSDEARRIAWGEFATHTGAARAVWLVRTFTVMNALGETVVSGPAPADLRTEPAFPRIAGFPDELHIWLARGGGPPTHAATLTIDHARLRTDFPDPETGERRWWDDWDEAVLAGLATKLSLDGDPHDIDALYVTGLGEDEPAKVFASHRDEGVLGLLRTGTPTNTVDGAPAASLATDPDTWWTVLHEPAADAERQVSHALTGDPDLLGNLPGDADPHREWSAALVSALWPALWGFAADDVWNLSPGSPYAAAWAPRAIFPSGPFPALRVGSQPYGLLPATALERWVRASSDPEVEHVLRRALVLLVQRWRVAAEARGTVAGADTDELLDLLASVPTAPGYRQRRAWPLELWWLLLLFAGGSLPWSALDAAWRKKYAIADELHLNPARRYGSLAASRPVEIPLVRPPAMPPEQSVGDLIRQVLELVRQFPGELRRPRTIETEFLFFPLDSVLLRLIIRSLQVVVGDIGRERLGEAPPPDPEHLARPDSSAGRLETWLEQVKPEDLRGGIGNEALDRVLAAIEALAAIPEDRIDGLLRATLDTAIYRIDPWVVGLPARRLQSLLDDGSARHVLGAYGWVDHPAPGTPGPTEAGMLFAPSPAQALAAAVIRDRAVNDAEPGRWAMDLTSRTVRDADRIAEHVRMGAHLAEALGREVERVVGDPEHIERLRRDFPVHTAHAGRRTCDGLAVLRAAPATLGLGAPVLAGLVPLRAALEAYGDLLIAEAVHHVAEGRAEAAGAVMDAAAGLARPPRLDLLRTRRPGRSISTSTLVVLPGTGAPPVPSDPIVLAEQSPARLADAAAAGFIADRIGAGTEWAWTVANGPANITVRLSDLGLEPVDVLALPLDDVERLVRERGAGLLGVADATTVTIDAAGGSDRYERAARLAAVLGRNPATADGATESVNGTAPDGTDIRPDLRARHDRVRATAEALRDRLGDALAGTTPGGEIGTADAAMLARLLTAARRWGIAPDAPTAVLAGTGPGTAAPPDPLVWSATRARELLVTRLAAAPPPSSAPVDELVAAMGRLVSPTGQLAILSRLAAGDLPALTRSGAAGDVDLDNAWLPVTAGVREPLARLEAHLLEESAPGAGGAPLVAWSNRPADPWQLDPADVRRLVVAYAAPGLDPTSLAATAPIAAALVDRFGEFVPDQEQSAGVAFGFDAPAARAQQAILLAVQPDLDKPLDPDTLVAIVAETRDLARARMARPADLHEDLAALVPTALLPATGDTATSLDFTPR